MSNNENVLLKDRKAFTARQSIDSLISFARFTSHNKDSRMKRFTSGIKDSSTPETSASTQSSRSPSSTSPTYNYPKAEYDPRKLEKHLSHKLFNHTS